MMRWQGIAAIREASKYQCIHRSALMEAARIDDNGTAAAERDLRWLTAFIKDNASFEFWPVYERPGWYTRNPSEEVRIIAEYESAKRNLTEQSRNESVLTRYRKGSGLHGRVTLWAAQHRAYLGQLELDLPEPDRDDFCLTHIDRLIDDGLIAG